MNFALAPTQAFPLDTFLVLRRSGRRGMAPADCPLDPTSQGRDVVSPNLSDVKKEHDVDDQPRGDYETCQHPVAKS
eukprot:4295622-Prymnesium_polylepis.1